MTTHPFQVDTREVHGYESVMKKPKLQSLNCPGCGASLRNDPGVMTIRCDYCGNTLVFEAPDPEPAPNPTKASAPQAGPAYQGPAVIEIPHSAANMHRQVQTAVKVSAFLPAIIIFSMLILGGVITAVTMTGVKQQTQQAQTRAEKIREEADQRKVRMEEEREQREKERWMSRIDGSRKSLPENFDKLLADSLPDDWPTLTIGPASAPVTITWYVSYAGVHDRRFGTAMRGVMRRFDGQVKWNVIPVPSRLGRSTGALEGFLELLEQKGEDAFDSIHERLLEDGYSWSLRGNFSALCEALDCDLTRFNRAMKQKKHASRVKPMETVSRRLGLDRHTIFRIQDDLFSDASIIVAQLEEVVDAYLKWGSPEK